ncbi:hypothetical protein CFOL_v3_08135, partial [Cephalotus follicularis]
AEKPYVSQDFDTLDEVYNFYNCYALREGFGIRKPSSSQSKNEKWVVTRFVEEHSHILDTPRRVSKRRSHNISHKNVVAKNLMDQFHSCAMRHF